MRLPMVFLDGPWRMAMGLNRLDPADWIWLSGEADAEIAEKRRLLAERPEVVLRAPAEALPAARELLTTLLDHLPAHHPDRFAAVSGGVLIRPTGEVVRGDDPEPLRAAGLLVQEDLCLMAPGGAGYTLAAAFLAFPSRWLLSEKLLLPMRAIHANVPGFDERLAGPADRFFAAVEVDRPVWRANWGLTDDPTLHQPIRKAYRPVPLDAGDAGEHLYVRVERQTLRRLPRTRHVVFTIHTIVRRLTAVIAEEPAVAPALAARLREMPDAMLRYKNLLEPRPAILAWLDRVALGQGAQEQPQPVAGRGAGEPQPLQP
jgi:hypothetical protein